MSVILSRIYLSIVIIAINLVAVIANACTVTASGVDFGTYDPFAAADVKVTGTINIECSSKTNMTVSLSTGQSGSYSSRTLMNGTNQLSYNLYRKSNHTKVWGDGSGGSKTEKYNSRLVNATIYGSVFAGQMTAAVGSYTDSITVTVDY